MTQTKLLLTDLLSFAEVLVNDGILFDVRVIPDSARFARLAVFRLHEILIKNTDESVRTGPVEYATQRCRIRIQYDHNSKNIILSLPGYSDETISVPCFVKPQ